MILDADSLDCSIVRLRRGCFFIVRLFRLFDCSIAAGGAFIYCSIAAGLRFYCSDWGVGELRTLEREERVMD